MRVLVREPIADAGIELLRERFDVDVDANGDLSDKASSSAPQPS